jgi:hypothetical protein
MAAMTNYLENKLTDQIWRGQAYTFPSTMYFALHTTATDDAGGGTEVTGGSYARVGVPCTLTDFAGTQGAGTTTASSGTSGTTSNNAAITFPAPTANWGTITHMSVWDAASSGNMLFHGALSLSKTVNNGDAAPSFAAGAFTFQVDN